MIKVDHVDDAQHRKVGDNISAKIVSSGRSNRDYGVVNLPLSILSTFLSVSVVRDKAIFLEER